MEKFSSSQGSLTVDSDFLFLKEQWKGTVFKLAWFSDCSFRLPIFDGTMERNSFQALVLYLLIQASYF